MYHFCGVNGQRFVNIIAHKVMLYNPHIEQVVGNLKFSEDISVQRLYILINLRG